MKKTLLFILLAAVMLPSCEKVIDLDVDAGPTRLVVDSWYTDEDTTHYVKLSTTAPYFENSPVPRVSNALVVLHTYVGDVLANSVVLPEDAEKPGFYLFPAPAEIGKGYQLEIDAPGLMKVKSDIQLVRPVPPVLQLDWQESTPDFQDSTKRYQVLLTTFETPGLGDNYRWFTWVNGVYQNAPSDITISNDDWVDGSFIAGLDITNKLYRFGDVVRISQSSINRNAYVYLSLLIQQTAFVGSPFDSPPAQLIGNMKDVNGDGFALGFFGVSATSIDEILIGE
jgi:hypothetical protein